VNVQKVDTNVGNLVDMIERGELRLPEMQRRYVWTATRVRDLLDSLYRGYPSGTILVWEAEQQQPSRDFQVGQTSSPFAGHRLLLDGQQRLTSLSAILRGEPIQVRNRNRDIQIAFNLDHPEGGPEELIEVNDDADQPFADAEDDTIIEGEDDEDVPTIKERLRRRTFAVASRSLLSQPNWVLVSDVLQDKNSDWQLIRPLVSGPDDPKFESYNKRLQRLRAIRAYPYVMQIVSRGFSYEEVAEIFVRVNSLGVKLRGSDLALALITAKWPKSLQVLERFIDECDERTWFTLDLGLLARAIVVFATRQSRFRTVSALSRGQLEEGWAQAKKGLEFAVNFLRSNAGIEDESLLSSPLFLIPIAVCSQLKSERHSPEDERHLLRWLYLGNARGHYSGSSETTLDADLSLLFKRQDPACLIAPLEAQFGRLHIEPSDFEGRGIRSALFSTAYLAMKDLGAKDWFTGLGLALTHQGRCHFIQFHHIFAKALLQEHEYEKSEINEIANMAFIAGRTNQRISRKAPLDYLPAIIQERGEATLSAHQIPMDRELWKIEHFRSFLQERRRLLADAVNKFIGRAFEVGSVRDFRLGS
jgi:hypothetical protein